MVRNHFGWALKKNSRYLSEMVHVVDPGNLQNESGDNG